MINYRRGYKIAIIFCVSLSTCYFSLFSQNQALNTTQTVHAAWYNSDPDWSYRQKFTITNPNASELTSYPLLLSEEMVGRWKFDEGSNSNVADSSGYSLDGTITGLGSGIAWSSSGQYASALSFSADSNSYVSIGNNAVLMPADHNLTISTWIKTSSSSQQKIISKGMNASYSKGYMLEINNGYIYAGIGSSSQSTSVLIKTTGTFNDGSWHNIVLVVDGSGTQAYIYLDNSLAAIEAVSGTCGSVSSNKLNFSSCSADISMQNSNYLYLGRQDDAASCPFDGLIDETRIFNKVLSSNEIDYLYQNNVSPVLQKLIYSIAQEDGDDLRFTTSDGSTSITYYLEKFSSVGQNARIWLKVPSIASGPTTTDIYVYYGNSAATSASSNYSDICSYTDNFNDDSLSNDWTLTTDGDGSISESGSNLDFSYDGTNTDWWSDPINRQVNILKYNTVPNYYFWAQIKLESYATSDDTQAGISIYGDDDSAYLFGRTRTATNNYYDLEKIGTHNIASLNATTMPAWLAVSNTTSGYSFWLSFDNLSWQKIGSYYSDVTLNNIALFGKSSTNSLSFSMDDFVIKKFMQTQPTIAISGSYENPTSELEFTIEGVSSGSTNNGVTTNVGSTYDGMAFGILELATPKYAAQKITVKSNGVGGYSVTVKIDGYIQGIYPANKIDPFGATNVSWTTPQVWSSPDGSEANTDSGWIGANTSDTRVDGWSSASGKFGPLSSTAHEVMRSTTHDSGTSAYVSYAFEISAFQPPDIYSGVIEYNIIATY